MFIYLVVFFLFRKLSILYTCKKEVVFLHQIIKIKLKTKFKKWSKIDLNSKHFKQNFKTVLKIAEYFESFKEHGRHIQTTQNWSVLILLRMKIKIKLNWRQGI